MSKFQLTHKFKGYIEREDITNTAPNQLIKPSQNVLSKDGLRVGIREGYEIYGATDTTETPIESATDWKSHRGYEHHLRVSEVTDGSSTWELEAEYEDAFYPIKTDLARGKVRFSPVWDTTEQQDVMLFVDGTTSIHMWSGGLTTFASATSTTITKQGTDTWAESGFLLTGTRQVIIDGTTYTYTGGETTTQLTGVTPDPTSAGHSAGEVIVQAVRSTANTPVASATITASTIAFVDSDPDTLTDSGNGFVTAGFQAGDVITVSGSTSNDGTYKVATVAAGTITLDAAETLVAEGSGDTVTITAVRPWTNDLLITLNNQLFVGCETRRDIKGAVVGDYTDYSAASSPRQVGESVSITLDSTPTGFAVDEETLYISGSAGDWYKINFELSADLTKEEFKVDPLKISPNQHAISQEAIFKTKNDIIFISADDKLETLGRVENISTPQAKPLSYPVKNLLERLDSTNACGIYHKDFVYLAYPVDGFVLMYNVIEGFWEAPQVLPVRRFSINEGSLHGHSSTVKETYNLFTGYNDNTNPIEAKARFAYNNYGRRDKRKAHDEWYSEGYITSNTKLECTLYYDYEGGETNPSHTINGDDDAIIFGVSQGASLGKKQLGEASLGGAEGTTDENLPPKFRIIKEMIPEPVYYELSPEYSSNDIDFRWEVLCFGPNAVESDNNNSDIKQ